MFGFCTNFLTTIRLNTDTGGNYNASQSLKPPKVGAKWRDCRGRGAGVRFQPLNAQPILPPKTPDA